MVREAHFSTIKTWLDEIQNQNLLADLRIGGHDYWCFGSQRQNYVQPNNVRSQLFVFLFKVISDNETKTRKSIIATVSNLAF